MIAAASWHTSDIEKVLGGKGKASKRSVWASLNVDTWARHEGADVFCHVFPLVAAPLS
jgi:hypothetical protein